MGGLRSGTESLEKSEFQRLIIDCRSSKLTPLNEWLIHSFELSLNKLQRKYCRSVARGPIHSTKTSMGTKSHDEEYGIKSGDKKKRGKRSKRDRESEREERAVRHEHSSRHRYESSERASYTPRHKSRRERDRSEDEYKKRSPRRESKYNDTDPKERKLRDHRKREKKRNHHERRKREERKEHSRSRDKRRSSSSDRSKGVNRRRRADASERKMRSKSRAREQRKTNREKNRSKPSDESTDSKRRERYSRDQKTHVPERKIIEGSRDRKSDKDRNKYETQHINTQQADTSERMTRRRRPPPPPPPRRRKGADKIDSVSPRQVNHHLDVKTSSKSNTETKQTKHPGSAPNKHPITSPSKSKSKSTASRRSQSDDWRCSSCTTMNDYKRPCCVNCGGKHLGKDSRPKDSQAPIQKCSLDTNVLSQIQDTKVSVKKAAKENKKAPKIHDTEDSVKKAATDNKKAQKKKGILGLFSFGKKTKTSKEDYPREKPKAKEASKETRVENYPQKHLEEPLFTKVSSSQRERRRNVTRKRTDSRGSSKSSNSSTSKTTKQTSGETKRITTSALNKRVLSDMSSCGTDLESPKPKQVSDGHSSKLSSKSAVQIPRSAKNIPSSALSGGVLSDISSGTQALKSSIPNKKQAARENSKLAPDKKKKSNRPATNSIPMSALSRGVLSDISSGMQALKSPALDHTPKEKNTTTLTTEPKPESQKSSGLSSSEDTPRSALSKGLLSDISSGTKVLKQSKDAPEQTKKPKANKPLSIISQIQNGKALKSVNDRKNAEPPKPKRPISVLDQIKAPPRPLKKVERIANEEAKASASANGNGNGNNTAIESIIARRQFYGSNRSSSNMASDRSGYDSEEWD